MDDWVRVAKQGAILLGRWLAMFLLLSAQQLTPRQTRPSREYRRAFAGDAVDGIAMDAQRSNWPKSRATCDLVGLLGRLTRKNLGQLHAAHGDLTAPFRRLMTLYCCGVAALLGSLLAGPLPGQYQLTAVAAEFFVLCSGVALLGRLGAKSHEEGRTWCSVCIVLLALALGFQLIAATSTARSESDIVLAAAITTWIVALALISLEQWRPAASTTGFICAAVGFTLAGMSNLPWLVHTAPWAGLLLIPAHLRAVTLMLAAGVPPEISLERTEAR
ncbi:MAG: hypothetical protein GY788_13285 [bacterium]|nr:hypothetical protein [bacterium]